MNRWEDAIFELTRQKRFLESPGGQNYMARFERAMRQKEYGQDRFHQLPDGFLWNITHSTVMQADPIYTSDKVLTLVDHARESFEPEPVLPGDPFCPVGFALFPRSLPVLDKAHKKTPVRAIGWVPVTAHDADGMEKASAWITFWSHVEDDGNPEVSDQEPVGRHIQADNPHAVLTVIHSFFMAFGQRAWESIDDDAYREASVQQWKLVQTYWRIGQQTVRTPERAPRNVRKDAKRNGMNQEAITVVTLRKARDHDDPLAEEGEGGRLSVQFIVRGHWRQQHYKSLGPAKSEDGEWNPESHRQIWINPYVKGPEDAPLRLTTRVFDFKR